MSPFEPLGPTVNISVSSSSQSVLVDGDGGSETARVKNSGTADAFIQWGTTSGATATLTGSMPVGAGVTEVLTPNIPAGSAIWVAAIAAGSTGSIYFTPGAGN